MFSYIVFRSLHPLWVYLLLAVPIETLAEKTTAAIAVGPAVFQNKIKLSCYYSLKIFNQ